MEPDSELELAEPGDAKAEHAATFWARVHEHKIIQWGIAYLGSALALAHGQELVGHAFHWPDVTNRIFIVALIVGFPIALTLAWYHGHRGLKGTSSGELMMISVFILIGAVFFAVALRPEPEHVASSTPALDRAAVPTAGGSETTGQSENALPNSVAVLPFENLSPLENDRYFAIGLHEEVHSRLAKLKNLTVISQQSVARYVDTDLTIPQIAAELRVGAVLECSVRYSNDRVRIAAQLIDAATDRPLWSDTYETDFGEVFAIQADIAMNIANALEAEFTPAEQQALEREPTSSTAAYALFLQARAALRSAQPGTREQVHGLLDRALAVDPDFGSAYGLKAVLYATSLINTSQSNAEPPARRAEVERLVRDYAERALTLDPTDTAGLGALGALDVITWDWRAYLSYEDFDTAATVGQVRIWIHSWSGDHARALQVAERGVQLNPNDFASYSNLGIAQVYAGDRVASTLSLAKAQELAPANPFVRAWQGFNAVAGNDAGDALAQFQLVERLLGANRPLSYVSELAYGYSRIGHGDDARRLFDELQAAATRSEVGSGNWALAYLAIGDEEQALARLEEVAAKVRRREPDAGSLAAMNLKMNFLADPRIEERRFAEVLNRIRGDY